jgi:hypothetical protein
MDQWVVKTETCGLALPSCPVVQLPSPEEVNLGCRIDWYEDLPAFGWLPLQKRNFRYE